MSYVINKLLVDNYLNTVTSDTNYVSYPLVYVDSDNTTVIAPTQNSYFLSSLMTSGLNNELVTKTTSKYYYYKIIDKWIYRSLKPLLAFVAINDDKPQLIKSLSDFNVAEIENNSSEDIEIKIKYLQKILITVDNVKHVLKKIIKKNNYTWQYIKEHQEMVQNIFYDYFINKLKSKVRDNN